MLLECLLYGEYMTGRVFNCKCVVVFAPKKFCAIDVWLLSGVEAEDVAEGVIGFDDVVVSIDEGYAVRAGCPDDAQLFLQGFRLACLLYCSSMLCICPRIRSGVPSSVVMLFWLFKAALARASMTALGCDSMATTRAVRAARKAEKSPTPL